MLLTATTRIDLDSYPYLDKVSPPQFASNTSLPGGPPPFPHRGFSLPFTPISAAMAGQAPGGGGWNSNFGWDDEGAPGSTGPPFMNPSVPGMPYGATPTMMNTMMNTPSYAWPQAGVPGYPGAPSYYPNQRFPQPHPRVSPDVPGLNMVNSTGGAGCEPGYNYIFHDEHTKIHVFRTKEPPWRAPRMNYSFAKFQVPTNTTIAELMLRFGACNPNPALNRIVEVIEGGGGRWYRGMIFQGDQMDVQKTLKDCGWDRSRSGREKAVVWLWITKD